MVRARQAQGIQSCPQRAEPHSVPREAVPLRQRLPCVRISGLQSIPPDRMPELRGTRRSAAPDSRLPTRDVCRSGTGFGGPEPQGLDANDHLTPRIGASSGACVKKIKRWIARIVPSRHQINPPHDRESAPDAPAPRMVHTPPPRSAAHPACPVPLDPPHRPALIRPERPVPLSEIRAPPNSRVGCGAGCRDGCGSAPVPMPPGR